MKFIKFVIFTLYLYSGTVLAVPLDDWPTWNTNFPFIAKQVPPNALIARCKGLDTYCVVEIDKATGELPVALSGASISIDFSGATGAAVPAKAGFFGGTDPGGLLRGVRTDTNGELRVDVLTSALPTGAATETTLAAINTKTPTVAQKTMANSSPVVIASDQSSIPVTVSSLPLPAGAATETTLAAINTKTPSLGQATMVGSVPVVISSNQSSVPVSNLPTTVAVNVGASDANTLRVTEGSRAFSIGAYYDYSTGSVTTGAWTQLIASTGANTNLLCITDQSGQAMEIGVGAAAAEARVFLLAPGFSGCVPLRIASSARVAVRAVSATASTGSLTISGLN